MKTIKAIIVDDLVPFRELVVIQFSGSNIVFFEAGNGLQALEILKMNNDIDLIITDIEMPEMNGVELTRTIRNNFFPPKCFLPIIGMTSYDAHNEREFEIAGFDDVIQKSDEIRMLVRIIKRHLPHLEVPE